MDVLVENFTRGESESAKNEIATGLVSGRFALHAFVESLGPALTSQRVESRANGTKLLADVLHAAHPLHLQPIEVNLLVEFFCNRLNDRHIVVPHVLSGFLAIAMYHKLAEGQAKTICHEIFREVQMQALPQRDRLSFYNLSAIFLEKYVDEIKEIGGDFVFGYIQAMDGEKDPRNLVICFRTVKCIVNSLSFDMFAEELFEVVACYFPIDFSPPPNDPHGITKDGLVLGLRRCLAATGKFAKFCVPLLIEKLTSNVKSAKVDSLLTLNACCNVYTASDLAPFLEELWLKIRKEIFHALHQEVQEEALNSLQAVTRALSATVIKADAENFLEKYLETILKELKADINDSEYRRIHISGKVIQRLAAASDPACYYVVNTTLPDLLGTYTQISLSSHQRTILETLLGLLSSAQCHSNEGVSSPFLLHKDPLLMTLYTTLNHSDSAVICTGISCLVALMRLPRLLREEELVVTSRNFILLLLGEHEDAVKKEIKEALSVLSTISSEITERAVVQPLLHILNIGNDDSDSELATWLSVVQSAKISVKDVVTTLTALCTSHDLLKTIIPKLLEFLAGLLQSDRSLDERAVWGKTLLDGLASVVQERQSMSSEYFKELLLPHLIGVAVETALREANEEIGLFSSISILTSMCSCVKFIVSSVDIGSQKEIVDSIGSLFLGKSCTLLPIIPEGTFQPLELTSHWKQTQLICFLTSVTCHANREVVGANHSDLVEKLFHLALNSEHDFTRVEAAKCFGGLVNRTPTGEALDSFLTTTSNQLYTLMENASVDLQARERALTVYLWLCRALVTRSHPANQSLVEKLIDLFETDLFRQAAEGFQVILSDSDDVISNYKVANVKLMYKQHFFLQTVPKLVKKFNETNEDKKEPHLKALSCILLAVPKEVLRAELPSLFPLLMMSLSSSSIQTRKISLSVLLPLIADVPLFFSQHVELLIANFVQLARHPDDMKIRVTALQCLCLLATLPHHTIYPHKNRVIRELSETLDDKKRLVRKEAVKCRSLWFLLGDLPS
ncbi:MMS19 nucleotide excision repair protein homolog isoform X2 [Oscarella lobularis]|uniref:MMS19 nucleotide excision repair protein homolog isoform X2 n=1 Tax=Oscarella lobularis TaxID=121494 RepID=UPI003313CE3A